LRKVLFILDLGSSIGGGHYSRCLSISRRLRNCEVIFLIRKHGYIDPLFCKLDNHIFVPGECSADELLDYIGKYFGDIICCVCDITNQITLSNKGATKNFLTGLKKYVGKVVLIDGRAEGRLISDHDDNTCDVLITPYVGSERVDGEFQHLYGEKYFVLPEYKCVDSLLHKDYYLGKEKLNLLITFGQSDPNELTEYILNILINNNTLLQKFCLKVVLGAHVAEIRIKTVRSLLDMLKMSCELILAPASLQDCFEWADLAISATGLTKYEMAFFGLPSVLISATRLDALLQVPFDVCGTSFHIGFYEDLDDEVIVDTLTHMYNNIDCLALMSIRGRSLIDGLGSDRIASVISGCK
jgi:UDP-2,4-diacetamido-2,4,6-trideoxy-beta-L-altropyranose hydrolase